MTACTHRGCTCANDRPAGEAGRLSREEAQERVSAWLASPVRDHKIATGTGNTDPRRDVRGGR